MTLLFFLRSPAGNTDTGHTPGVPVYWDVDDAPKRKTRKEVRKAKRLAGKLKRIRDEEMLMVLFMHEFEGYDD